MSKEGFRSCHRLLCLVQCYLNKLVVVSHKGSPSLRAANTRGEDRSGLCSISSVV